MHTRHRMAVFSSCLLSVVAVAALSAGHAAPVADRASDPQGGSASQNLQVLRKDVSEAELKRLMERYSDDLGVACSYCHVEKADGGVDYASDDSPAKQTSRIMIAMLNDINKRYLAQIGDRRYALPFSCGNCHQGQTSPPEFESRRRP